MNEDGEDFEFTEESVGELVRCAIESERDRIIALLLEAGHDENDAVIAKIRSGE